MVFSSLLASAEFSTEMESREESCTCKSPGEYICRLSVASDQDLHCLLTGLSIKNGIKATNLTRQPYYDKWTCPKYNSGRFHNNTMY